MELVPRDGTIVNQVKQTTSPGDHYAKFIFHEASKYMLLLTAYPISINHPTLSYLCRITARVQQEAATPGTRGE